MGLSVGDKRSKGLLTISYPLRGTDFDRMTMTDRRVMREIKALIRWYERRGKNWLMAAEFMIWRHHGGTIGESIVVQQYWNMKAKRDGRKP